MAVWLPPLQLASAAADRPGCRPPQAPGTAAPSRWLEACRHLQIIAESRCRDHNRSREACSRRRHQALPSTLVTWLWFAVGAPRAAATCTETIGPVRPSACSAALTRPKSRSARVAAGAPDVLRFPARVPRLPGSQRGASSPLAPSHGLSRAALDCPALQLRPRGAGGHEGMPARAAGRRVEPRRRWCGGSGGCRRSCLPAVAAAVPLAAAFRHVPLPPCQQVPPHCCCHPAGAANTCGDVTAHPWGNTCRHPPQTRWVYEIGRIALLGAACRALI